MNNELVYFIASSIGICSFFFTNILYLRLLYLLSSILFVFAGILYHVNIMIIMNFCYFLINFIQITRSLIARTSIFLPEQLKPIYEQVFAGLFQRDFLFIINLGTIKACKKNELICLQGSTNNSLWLIIHGELEVSQNHKTVAHLTDNYYFIGEMRFFTQRPMSADILAKTEVTYIEWNTNKIRELQQKNKDLYLSFTHILAKDLIKKLQINADNPINSVLT